MTHLKKLSTLATCALALLIIPTPIQAIITKVHSVREGLVQYPDLSETDLVVCDIDNTLIKHHRLPKKLLAQQLDQQMIMRQFVLLDPTLPQLFQELHDKRVPIVALTHTRTGTFGIIPSMEQWRLNMMNNLNLTFSFDQKNESFLLVRIPKPHPSFTKGIILSGHHSKGTVLKAFLAESNIMPKRILFFDDLKNNIRNVHDALAKTTYVHCFHVCEKK